MSLRAALTPVQGVLAQVRAAAAGWSCELLGSTAIDLTRGLASDTQVPQEIKLKQGGKRLDVLFADGSQVSLSAEYLRVMSPSADTLRPDALGQTRVVSGRRHVCILGIDPVGRYAIRLRFDDLHQAGIYSWDLLHDLGTRKWHHMRRYVVQLRSKGLSRDPKARKSPAGKPVDHHHHDGRPCSDSHQ